MEPKIEFVHGDEAYVAPDVEQLGTAETLTAGGGATAVTQDQISLLN